MKIFKKLTSIALCLILCTFMCTTVFAAAKPSLKISDASASAGQEVTIDVSLSENPGIMAMAFSITYDNSQFTFVDVTKGFVSTPTYKDHSDKGYVAFSISETSDKTTDGTIISLKFKIKDNAKPGKYAIKLGNSNYEKYGNKIDNCFSNSKEVLIVPTITAGSITVEGECDKVGHSYGDWSVSKAATCTEDGLKSRTCSRCGNVEEVVLPRCHQLEEEWTVDKVATPEENGIMSRHCKVCGEHFEEIIFTYDEVTDSNKDNPSSESDTSSNSNPQGEQTSSTTGSTSSTTNKKPGINNTVGAKNPLEAVEDTKDYQDKLNAQKLESNSAASDSQVNTTGTLGKISSFFASPVGIILIVVFVLLCVSIIVFGIILIIMNNKKSKH